MPLTNKHILTEASDRLQAENSDLLITEQQDETGGAGTASLLPGRWQYQSLFEVFVTSAAPVLDKLQPILDIVQPLIPRRAPALSTAILAGSFFMPLPAQPPVPRMDSWYEITQTPPKDQKRQQYTFQFFDAPDQQSVPRLDSWRGNQPERIDGPRDNRWTGRYIVSLERVIVDQQYPDKWLPSEEVPPRGTPDLSYIPRGEFSGDLYGPNFRPTSAFPQVSDGRPSGIPDLSYIPRGEFSGDLNLPFISAGFFVQVSDGKPREPADLSYIVPQEWVWDSTYDADYSGTWQYQDVNPFERVVNPVLYTPHLAWPERQPVPLDIGEMGWQPAFIHGVENPRWSYPSFFRTDIVIAAALSQTDWMVCRPDVLLRVRDIRYTYPSFDMPDLQPLPDMDGWIGYHPDYFRAKDVRWAHQTFFRTDVVVPSVPFDWLISRPDILFRPKELRFGFPFFDIPDGQPLPPFTWNGYQPNFIYRAKDVRWTYQFFDIPDRQPEPPLGSWEPQFPDKIWGLQNRLWVTSGVLELTQAQRPEATSPDRWFGYHPDILYRAKDVRWTYPSVAQNMFSAAVELVTLDKWYRPLELPTRRIDSRTYITAGDLILAAAQRPEATLVSKWYEPIVQPVRAQLWRAYPSLMVGRLDVVTPEGPVTMDKWYHEIVGPKFLRRDDGHIRASGFNFFTIKPSGGVGNDRLILVDGRWAIRIGFRTYTFI